MAYEVWLFERRTGGTSKLLSVTTCPPEYGYADADRWAATRRGEYAKVGLDLTTMVRVEGCY